MLALVEGSGKSVTASETIYAQFKGNITQQHVSRCSPATHLEAIPEHGHGALGRRLGRLVLILPLELRVGLLHGTCPGLEGSWRGAAVLPDAQELLKGHVIPSFSLGLGVARSHHYIFASPSHARTAPHSLLLGLTIRLFKFLALWHRVHKSPSDFRFLQGEKSLDSTLDLGVQALSNLLQR